jgi:3-methyl-2-oxobutanoate hydroxymethyltransferase
MEMKGGEKIVCVTAYDWSFAHLAQSAGVDVILVGDSVGNTTLGYANTLAVSLEEMVHHTAAVARAEGPALIVADLPFGTFGTSVAETVHAAIRLVKAGAEAVKLEGPFVDEITAIQQIGIPVMGHVGMTPQSVHRFGGFRVQGKREADAEEILLAAQAIENAGAFAVVVELVPTDLAARMTSSLAIPTIGIGAGPNCDGQIQVMHDLLGISEGNFRHARRFAELGQAAEEGFADYANAVRKGQFPTKQHSFSMKIVRTIAEVPPPLGKRGFVPTMGALHAGHLSLVGLAKQLCEEVVVSVFVNPKQFGPKEDLDRYPRQEAEDRALCKAAGVDVFFAPSSQDMYPFGMDAATIHIGEVGDLWEGALRPGHFDGVATVVAKLCHMVDPSLLILGEKDLQQCAVVQRMIEALNEKYALVIGPTQRESDGLAMSSRNAYLNAEERARAPQIYRALMRAKSELLAHSDVLGTLQAAREALANGFDLQYFELVNRASLKPITELEPNAGLIVAAYCGTTRLIDNVLIN